MAEVRLEDVNKIYTGDVHAVKNVDLEIADHEFVVLVGPSGCGKTTTLRMVAGLEDISSGTIKIGDRIVNDVAPKDRDIAMVFQNYALYPHMTVYKNLAFALKLRKVPKSQIEERVQWAAKTLGLEELLNRRPRQLSGGQRQRVAVGRAIVRKPQVFLFDEPLSNLDAKLRVTTRAELKKLQQDLRTTTIYVTHDQEEAMTLGDRVVVMNGGRIHQSGTPLEVYRHPVNRFVAGFVGMPPMNFVDGKLAGSGGDLAFVSAGVRADLGDARFDTIREESGRAVVLGMRPEGITVTGDRDSSAISVSATVDVVEILGPTMDLFVTLAGGEKLVCRVPTAETRPGAAVTLYAQAADLHLFAPNQRDGDTVVEYGANLTLPAAMSVS
jgi:multiple sugar transport system ATP-binding protein